MPSGDSISRFDSSRDMFNIRTSPVEQKIAARNKGVSGKDTIQTHTPQSKRTGPIMILTRSSLGSGGRAVKIARAGRFVFFALALPPFLAFYSLPKWVVVNVIPKLFQQVEKGIDHAKKFFQQIVKVLAEGVGSPFRNLLGKINWKSAGVQKQNASLLSYMKEKIVNFGAAFYKATARSLKFLGAMIEKPAVAVKEKLQLLGKRFSKLLGLDRDKASDKSLPKMAGAFVAKMTAPLQTIVNLMVPQFKNLAHSAKLGLGWGREKILNSVDALRRGLLPKLREAERIYESVQATVVQKAQALTAQIVQPMINLCVPSLQFLKKHLSFGIGWFKKKPKEQLWNMRKKMQKFLSGASPYAKEFYEKSNRQLQKMKAWFIGPLFRFLKRLFPFIPWLFKLFLGLIRKVWGYIKLLGGIVKERTRRFHFLVIPIKNRSLAMINYLVKEVKSLLKAPGAYLLGLLRRGLNMVLKILKGVAIVIIGIGLVFKYWFQMLFEISDELGGWLREKQGSGT